MGYWETTPIAFNSWGDSKLLVGSWGTGLEDAAS